MAGNKKAKNSICRYAIEGDMTIYRVTELKQQFVEKIAAHQEIEVDLSGVGEIDAAGLQLMVMAKLEASIREKVLRFDGHSAAILEILDLSGLTGFFGDPVVISSSGQARQKEHA